MGSVPFVPATGQKLDLMRRCGSAALEFHGPSVRRRVWASRKVARPAQPTLSLLAAAAFALLVHGVALADPCKAIPDHGPMPAYLYRGATFSGPVTYVGDGDSLCVDVLPHTTFFRPGGSVERGVSWVEVRLADFYAPELHEAGGEDAKRRLEQLVRGRTLTCTAEHQSYDRVVAQCELDGRSVGDLLRAAGGVEGGRAYHNFGGAAQ